MRSTFYSRFVVRVCTLGLMLMYGCATSSNLSGNRYAGIYQHSKEPTSRLTIQYENSLYRISYEGADFRWEGVGYESGSKIIAVLKNLDEEDTARFLNISFPGNEQLFVITRDTEGEYVSDEYFQKSN